MVEAAVAAQQAREGNTVCYPRQVASCPVLCLFLRLFLLKKRLNWSALVARKYQLNVGRRYLAPAVAEAT